MAQALKGGNPPPGMDRISWMQKEIRARHKDIMLVLSYLRTINPTMR